MSQYTGSSVSLSMDDRFIRSYSQLVASSHSLGPEFGIYVHELSHPLPDLSFDYVDSATVCSSVLLKLPSGSWIFLSNAKVAPRDPQVYAFCGSNVILSNHLPGFEAMFRHFFPGRSTLHVQHCFDNASHDKNGALTALLILYSHVFFDRQLKFNLFESVTTYGDVLVSIVESVNGGQLQRFQASCLVFVPPEEVQDLSFAKVQVLSNDDIAKLRIAKELAAKLAKQSVPQFIPSNSADRSFSSSFVDEPSDESVSIVDEPLDESPLSYIPESSNVAAEQSLDPIIPLSVQEQTPIDLPIAEDLSSFPLLSDLRPRDESRLNQINSLVTNPVPISEPPYEPVSEPVPRPISRLSLSRSSVFRSSAPRPSVSRFSMHFPPAGRLSNPHHPVARLSIPQLSVSRPSLPRPQVAMPSLSQAPVVRPSIPYLQVYRPSMPRPPVAMPSLSQAPVTRTSIPQPQVSRPSMPRPPVAIPSLSQAPAARPSIPQAQVSMPSTPRPPVAMPSVPQPSVAIPGRNNPEWEW